MTFYGPSGIYNVDFRESLDKRRQCEQSSHNPLIVAKETARQKALAPILPKAWDTLYEMVSDSQKVEASEKGNG